MSAFTRVPSNRIRISFRARRGTGWGWRSVVMAGGGTHIFALSENVHVWVGYFANVNPHRMRGVKIFFLKIPDMDGPYIDGFRRW